MPATRALQRASRAAAIVAGFALAASGPALAAGTASTALAQPAAKTTSTVPVAPAPDGVQRPKPVAKSRSGGLVEPALKLTGTDPHATTVALTLDACMGAADGRILEALVADRVPATIFVTARWLRHNPQALALLRAHPELFEIENHGAEHLPAVLGDRPVFGLKPAGTPEAITAEVKGGADAIEAQTGARPHWYRDATARYSREAITLIRGLGFRIAGYSLNADVGASLMAANVRRRIDAARDGDVIIAHVNQPGRAAGAGVVAGIRDLEARGVRFVRLDAASERGDDGGMKLPPSI